VKEFEMSLPQSIKSRLRLPLIAGPMLRISGPDLVSAACRSGVIGAFPTVNARSTEELDAWLNRIKDDCARHDGPTAPICPNIIMRREPSVLKADLDVLVRHKTEMVIASVGSPEGATGRLHDVGCTVFADVASMRHVEKALEAGADGLVLLSAGAGGQTGWVNGMSFVRAVRKMFDGPIILSGGISDGVALWAARVLGCDLGLMATRFIATPESMATDPYRDMLVTSRFDDVMTTPAFTGIDANMLRPSVIAAGLDPKTLMGALSPEKSKELLDAKGNTPRRWVDIWSAGHTVSGVDAICTVAELIDELEVEYNQARRQDYEMLRADLKHVPPAV
jgi:nitronate monooxygenase